MSAQRRRNASVPKPISRLKAHSSQASQPEGVVTLGTGVRRPREVRKTAGFSVGIFLDHKRHVSILDRILLRGGTAWRKRNGASRKQMLRSMLDAYRARETDVQSVVRSYLDRIEAYDRKGPALWSIVTLNPKAMAEAEALDRAFANTGKLAGPLHGIPVLVKDNVDVEGLPTTGGSRTLIGWMPPRDATIVARLRAAGAVILAKTTMSEFARGGIDNINSVLPGFARNPYNTAHATGGSSGGTGAVPCRQFRHDRHRIGHLGLDPQSGLEQFHRGAASELGGCIARRHDGPLRRARRRRPDGPLGRRCRGHARRHRRRRSCGSGDSQRGGDEFRHRTRRS